MNEVKQLIGNMESSYVSFRLPQDWRYKREKSHVISCSYMTAGLQTLIKWQEIQP